MPQPEESSAIVDVHEALAMANVGSIEQIVATTAKRIDAFKRLRAVVLRLTGTYDWVDIDGRPFMQGSGAKKIADAFGVEFDFQAPIRESSPDGGYEYVIVGRVRATKFSDSWKPIVGSRWSKDGFFRDPVDPGDVRKAALENAWQEAVKTAVGLSTVTWEELKDAGIPREAVVSVTHDRGSRGGKSSGKSSANVPKPNEPALLVKVAYNDELNRGRVKQMGATWDSEAKAWLLADTTENKAALNGFGLGYEVIPATGEVVEP